MTVEGSNRVRGCKNYVHPPLTETGDSPAYGGASNGLSNCDTKSQHIFRPSLIESDKTKPKKVVASKGGASFEGGTTTKTNRKK